MRGDESVYEAIDEAIERARMEQYAGLSEEQLRRRLARAEDGRRRLANVLGTLLVVFYVIAFRKEIIAGLTKLGELAGDG